MERLNEEEGQLRPCRDFNALEARAHTACYTDYHRKEPY